MLLKYLPIANCDEVATPDNNKYHLLRTKGWSLYAYLFQFVSLMDMY